MAPVDVVRENLSRLGALEETKRIAAKHGVTLRDLASRRRPAHIVRARHEAWWVIWGTLGLSAAQVAIAWGVDHTTCDHAIAKMQRKAQESIP